MEISRRAVLGGMIVGAAATTALGAVEQKGTGMKKYKND